MGHFTPTSSLACSPVVWTCCEGFVAQVAPGKKGGIAQPDIPTRSRGVVGAKIAGLCSLPKIHAMLCYRPDETLWDEIVPPITP